MKRKPKGYWNYDLCKKESLKYKTRTEFNINCKGGYLFAHKNKWLDDICSHMENVGHKYKRCIYCYEFSDNSVYVGLTYNLDVRQNNRNSDKNDQVTKHIKETNSQPTRKQLTDYIDVNDAIKLEEFYVKKYIKEGWNILNKSKTGGIGSSELKWTKEKCKNEAIKYKNRKEFKIKNSSAYYSSIKNGWLDEICLHMKHQIQKPKNFWTKEKCLEYALKCKNIKEFKCKFGCAYNLIIKNNWNDIKNIIKNNVSWTYEMCKDEALKYKSKKDFKIKSPNAYNYSVKHKILNQISNHMIELKNLKVIGQKKNVN